MDGTEIEVMTKTLNAMKTLSEIEEICKITFQIIGKKTYDDKSVALEINTALQNISKMTARYYIPVADDEPAPAVETSVMMGVMAVETPDIGFQSHEELTIDPLTGAMLKRCCCCDHLKPVKNFEEGKRTCKSCEGRVRVIKKANKKASAGKAEA